MPLLVVVAAWLAHAGSLRADWVLDDAAVVRDSTAVRGGVPEIGAAFARDAWGGEVEPGVWRPLTVATFVVEAALWGETGARPAPFGFHVGNLLLHGFASLLLLAFLVRLFPSRGLLTAGAALSFAVHPLHAGTVTAVLGRADLLALVLGLAAANLWWSARGGRFALWPLAGLCLFLALLAKETAVVIPLLLLAAHAGRAPAGARRPPWAGALALAVPALVWAWLWAPGSGAGLLPGAVAGLEGWLRGTLGTVLPVGWVNDRALLADAGTTYAIVGATAAFALAAAVVGVLLLRLRAARVGAAAFLLALVAYVVGGVVAPDGAVLESRFAYIAALPLVLWAGLALEALITGVGSRLRVAAWGAALLALMALGYLSTAETRVWQNDETWHRAMLDRHPGARSLVLRLSRRLRSEVESARHDAAVLPSTSEDRARLLRRARRQLAEAEVWVSGARRSEPASSGVWRELGFIQWSDGRAADAKLSLLESLRLDPWLSGGADPLTLPAAHQAVLAETYHRLGNAVEALGELPASAAYHDIASQLAPGSFRIVRRAGVVLLRAERFGDGFARLRHAMTLAPDGAAFQEVRRAVEAAGVAAMEAADRHMREGRLAEEQTRYREALAHYEAALGAAPLRVEAALATARLTGEWFGDYRRAFGILDDADARLAESGHDASAAGRKRLARLRKDLERLQAEEEADEPGGGGG